MQFPCIAIINQQYVWLKIQFFMLERSTWKYTITSLGRKLLLEEIKLNYIDTKDQVADLFTKGLNSSKSRRFCHQLGLLGRNEVGVEGAC